MKPTRILYDPETRMLSLRLRAGRIEESDEVSPGVIIDYDARGSERNQGLRNVGHSQRCVSLLGRPVVPCLAIRGRVVAAEVLLPPDVGVPELSLANLSHPALLPQSAAKRSVVRERPARPYRSR